MAVLNVSDVGKIYTTRLGGNKVEALKNVTFEVEKGEYVAIMGESGSGKTTLLNILASLDKATSGEVILDGKKLDQKTCLLSDFESLHRTLNFVLSEQTNSKIMPRSNLICFGAKLLYQHRI